MKIEKPKSDNFLLSVTARPETQRIVVETICRCQDAKELEAALRAFTFWPWDRGDVLCWAPVLNLFDDYLMAYIVKNRLGGALCYQTCVESLSKGNAAASGEVTDVLIGYILHVTFLILESCSGSGVYNSSELLIAMLDSFNPTIVYAALQSLSLFHSCFRSKNRRQVDSRYSTELLLRLPFLCADPISHLTTNAQDEDSSSLPTNSPRHSQTVPSPSIQSIRSKRNRSQSQNSSDNNGHEASSQSNIQRMERYDNHQMSDATVTDDGGEIIRLYTGQVHVQEVFVKSQKLELRVPIDYLSTTTDVNTEALSHTESMLSRADSSLISTSQTDSCNNHRVINGSAVGARPWDGGPTQAVSIPLTDLLDGLSPSQIETLKLPELIAYQTSIFHKTVEKYFGDEALTAVVHNKQSTSRSGSLIDAQLEHLRQKIRFLWCGSHRLGRKWLVDLRLAALGGILCLNSQYFLNCLLTCPNLLPDLAMLLSQHHRLSRRTLCSTLDLWTGIIQEKIQHKMSMHLLGFASPHGLFPSIFREFICHPRGCNETIPVLLSYVTTDEEEKRKSEELQQQQQQQSDHNTTTTTTTTPLPPVLSSSSSFPLQMSALSNYHQSGTTSEIPLAESVPSPNHTVITSCSYRTNFDLKVIPYDARYCPNCDMSQLFDESDDMEDQKSADEIARHRCRVYENLIEMFLAVSVMSIHSLANTALLARLVDFLQVVEPSYLPAMVGICRIFESLMDFSPTAPTALYGALNAAGRLAQRLQFEIGIISKSNVLEGDMTKIASSSSTKQGTTKNQLETSLKDLSSPEALQVLKSIEEISHRRCLVRVIFKELASSLHPPDMSESNVPRLNDIYAGPAGLASRLIFLDPHRYGFSLYGTAVNLLAEFIGFDPASQPTLIQRQLVPDFLQSISPDVLQGEETLQAVPLCLASVLLHNSGEAELARLDYRPIDIAISTVTCINVIGLDRAGEISSIMGTRFDEASRNQSKAAPRVLQAINQMVYQIRDEALTLPKWLPVSPEEADEKMTSYLLSPPATVDDLIMPEIPQDRYILDRLSNMSRFLQNTFGFTETLSQFIKTGGAEAILDIITAPCIPPLFYRVLPHHPVASVIRLLATSSDPDRPSHSPPKFVYNAAEKLGNIVNVILALENVNIHDFTSSKCMCPNHHPDDPMLLLLHTMKDQSPSSEVNLSSSASEVGSCCCCCNKDRQHHLGATPIKTKGSGAAAAAAAANPETILEAVCRLDLVIYLLLMAHKDNLIPGLSSSQWRHEQPVSFIKLLTKSLTHIYSAFPVLLHFLYRNAVIESSETPVVLSNRHSADEHPGVRASKKYLPPEVQSVQPTNFFWTSLAHYAYSVPNPDFQPSDSTDDDHLQNRISDVPAAVSRVSASPTVVFEVIRTTATQCRGLLATSSRIANTVPQRRSRDYQAGKITTEQHVNVTNLAIAVQRFLFCVPQIPIPRLPGNNVASIAGGMSHWEIQSDNIKGLISVPGLSIIQTCRYIAEVMDIFYRLHVDDKNHGSLFTLTVDTFYKFGGFNFILRGLHYAFGALMAMGIRSVCDGVKWSTQEAIQVVCNLLGSTNNSFNVWLELASEEICNLPQSQFKAACDVVSKCLHCCISYCEKMTSWKRLYNSQTSSFLQKACGAPVEQLSTPPLNGLGSEPTDSRSHCWPTLAQGGSSNNNNSPPPQQGDTEEEVVVMAADTPVVVDAPSGGSTSTAPQLSLSDHRCEPETTTKISEMIQSGETDESFTDTLPPCGCGAPVEFNAATLLRSLQGEVARHSLVWIAGFLGLEIWKNEDVLLQKVNESIFNLFPTKAINCLVKIFFHFFDAESPQRQQHATTWRNQHSPSIAEYTERLQQQPNLMDDLATRETITRLVELQWFPGGDASTEDPLANLEWIFGSQAHIGEGIHAAAAASHLPSSQNNDADTTTTTGQQQGVGDHHPGQPNEQRKNLMLNHLATADKATQTDGSKMTMLRGASLKRKEPVKDWSEADASILRECLQAIILDLMLDLSWRMPGYCVAIGESLLKLVGLPLPLGTFSRSKEQKKQLPSSGNDDNDQVMSDRRLPANLAKPSTQPLGDEFSGAMSPTLNEAQIVESNAKFAAECLIDRLNSIYSFAISLPENRQKSLLLTPPPLSISRTEPSGSTKPDSDSLPQASEAMSGPSVLTARIGSITEGGASPSSRISPLGSAHGTPREMKATDDNLVGHNRDEAESLSKRLHETLHAHLYFFVNLLHRSPSACKALMSREESPFAFFHKFLALFTHARRNCVSVYAIEGNNDGDDSSSPILMRSEAVGLNYYYLNEPEKLQPVKLDDFSDTVSSKKEVAPEEVLADLQFGDAEFPIPAWCLQPCKPFLLKNETAVQAAQAVFDSQIKRHPLQKNTTTPSPVKIYDKVADLPAMTRPPDWFSCCFLGMIELLRLYELEHELFVHEEPETYRQQYTDVAKDSTDVDMEESVELLDNKDDRYVFKNLMTQKSGRLISAGLQKDLITTALDVLHFFPGLDGTLNTTILQLLVPLTSLPKNAMCLRLYKPIPIPPIPADVWHGRYLGGGLGVLLRLPRTAHFAGMLRLLAAVVANLCETSSSIEAKLEADILKLFSMMGEVRRLHPVETPLTAFDRMLDTESSLLRQDSTAQFVAASSDPPMMTATPAANTQQESLAPAPVNATDNAQTIQTQQTSHPEMMAGGSRSPSLTSNIVEGPLASNVVEERVVSLDTVLERLYPYLRKDPGLFKRVIKRMCLLYVEIPPTALSITPLNPGLATNILTEVAASETVTPRQTVEKSPGTTTPMAPINQSGLSQKEAILWLKLTSENCETEEAEEEKKQRLVRSGAAEVIPIIVDYIDTFTSIHAHTRLTPSFGDTFASAMDKPKPFISDVAKQCLIYPFAILPDTLLFILDDLLAANPAYAKVFLETCCLSNINMVPGVASATAVDTHGLVWPSEVSSGTPLAPWMVSSCHRRQGLTLLAWFMRRTFPKAVLLATPYSAATLEWREGEKASPSTSTSDSAELDALVGVSAGVSGNAPPRPAFETLMHLSTKLVRTLCNGGARIQHAIFVEIYRIMLELDIRAPCATYPEARNFQASVRAIPLLDCSPLRNYLLTLPPVPRHVFNVCVFGAASALAGVFLTPLSSKNAPQRRPAPAVSPPPIDSQPQSDDRSSSEITSKPVVTDHRVVKPLIEYPTPQDILAIRTNVCRLVGLVDLCGTDSQPVCRSLIRCLEFLVRDPVILLISIGVPESELIATLIKAGVQQRPEARPRRQSANALDTVDESSCVQPPIATGLDTSLLTSATPQGGTLLGLAEEQRATPHPEVHLLPASVLAGLGAPLSEDAGQSEEDENEMDEDDGDEGSSDEDSSGADDDDDLEMDEEDDTVAVLPHEADEDEETAGHFGVRRRSDSDIESADDSFDEEEDAPRIRDEDEATDAMLAMLPGEISHPALIGNDEPSGNGRLRLLREDDDESATPGLLNRRSNNTGSGFDFNMTEEASESDATEVADTEIADVDTEGEADDTPIGELEASVEVEGDEALLPEGSDGAALMEGLLSQQLLSLESFRDDSGTFLPGDGDFEDEDDEEDDDEVEEDEDDGVSDGEDEGQDEDEGDVEDLVGSAVGPNRLQHYTPPASTTVGRRLEVEMPLNVGIMNMGTMNVGYDVLGHRAPPGVALPLGSLYLTIPSNAPAGFTPMTPVPEATRAESSSPTGWTTPGDLNLPSFHPILTLSRNGARGTGGASGTQSAAASGTSHRAQPGPGVSVWRNALLQRNRRAPAAVHEAAATRESARESSQLASALSPGSLFFDPWSSMVQTNLFQRSGETVSRPTVAGGPGTRPPPPSLETERYERQGVNTIINFFREYMTFGDVPRRVFTTPPPRVARGLPPSEEQSPTITEPAQPNSQTSPEQPVADLAVSGSDSAAESQPDVARDRAPPTLPDSLPVSPEDLRMQEPQVVSEPQLEGREVGADEAEAAVSLEAQPPNPSSELIDVLVPPVQLTEASPIAMETPRQGTLEDYYYIIRHEEITDPVGLRVLGIRNLALTLGLTQRQLLTMIEVDSEFLGAMPPELLPEILGQQARQLSVSEVLNARNLNLQSLEQIREVVDNQPPSLTPSVSDTDAIRFLSEPENVEAGDCSPPSRSEDIEMAPANTREPVEEDSANVESSRVSDLTPTAADTDIPMQSDSVQPSATVAEIIPISRRRIDPSSCRVPSDILRSFSNDVRRLVTETINFSGEGWPHGAQTTTPTGVGATGAVDLDNATFLATLDPQLRQELLLTVSEEDLLALPPEYVAEATLLRERARHRQGAHHHISSGPRPTRRTPPTSAVVGDVAAVSERGRGNQGRSRTSEFSSHEMANLYNIIFSALQAGQSQVRAGLPSAGRRASPQVGSAAFFDDSTGSMRTMTMNSGAGEISVSGSSRYADVLFGQLFNEFGISVVELNRGGTFRRVHTRLPHRVIATHHAGVPGFPLALHSRAGQASGALSATPRARMVQNVVSPDLASFLRCTNVVGDYGPQQRLMRSVDLASLHPRLSSIFDSPISHVSVLAACRLLYLKRQIYRRDMHRLLLSLAGSHPTTRRQLLQLLMVVVWSAAVDIQKSHNLPPASEEILSLGFPPSRLYSATDLPASLLFDSDAEATAAIGAYRALEHTRSLLEVVPQTAEFFGILSPHPSFVGVLPNNTNACDVGSNSAVANGLSTVACPPNTTRMADDHKAEDPSAVRGVEDSENGVAALELRRKKKKRDNDQPAWPFPTTSSAKMTSGTSAEMKSDAIKATPKVLKGRSRARYSSHTPGTNEKKEEYPINILMILAGSSKFQSSSTHMLHLLSAIHFLICGSPSTTSNAGVATAAAALAQRLPAAPSASTNAVSGRAAPSTVVQSLTDAASIPGEPDDGSGNQGDGPSEEHANRISDTRHDSGVERGDRRMAASDDTHVSMQHTSPGNNSPQAGAPAVTTDVQTTPNAAAPSSRVSPGTRLVGGTPSAFSTTESAAAKRTLPSLHDRMLDVVSLEGAESICRIFAGLAPGDVSFSLWLSQISWSFSTGTQAQQSQWPLLSKIVCRLFWSPKHHTAVYNSLLNSSCTLVKFVMDCMVKLREHIVKTSALYKVKDTAAPSSSKVMSFNSTSAAGASTRADAMVLDLLPPENLREKFDTALQLLRRLSGSLQDVFWGDNATDGQKALIPFRTLESGSAPSRSLLGEPTPPSNIQLPAEAAAAAAAHLPSEASRQRSDAMSTMPQPQSSEVAHVASEAALSENASQFPSSTTLEKPIIEEKKEADDEELRLLEKERQALKDFKAFFDSAGCKFLWKLLDATLREIELACPSLKLPTSQALDSPITIDQEISEVTEGSRRDDLHQRDLHPRRARELLHVSRSRALDRAPLPETTVSAKNQFPPLLVNQLLPLIDTYFLVQQVTIAADFNMRCTEIPRINTLNSSSYKSDSQAAQNFIEVITTQLLNPDARLLESHADFLLFCERHRKILNLLIQQQTGILSGAFQPLVILAPMCISFENKRQYFRQRLKQLREGGRHEAIRLNVRRNLVFMDSFHQLRIRTGDEMKGKLVVHFQGEEGVDAGGLTREWYAILAKEMFNPDYALFRREGNKAEFNHPNALSYVNPDHLSFFKFIGRVIGKALYDGHHIGAYFTRSFYKYMLKRKITPSDAEYIDPEFYKNLQILLSHKIEDLQLDLHFSTEIDEFGRTQVVNLVPNGNHIAVTEENKNDYVRLICEHKISHGIRAQIDNFLEGFHELIPPKFLTIFDDKELELLISGLSFVDIADLRANTTYHGYESTSPQIIWLWEVLEDLDQNRLATFLQFVTGTSRVPLGGFKELMGMRGLQQFSIHRDYGDTRLPSAHTCFNQLDLPQYSSKEILKSKLLLAVSEGREGFGFV